MQSGWWTWAASAPAGRNPVEDRTGEHCSVNQPGNVWYLAGTFGGAVTRACAVPRDRKLVGPLVNLWATSSSDCDLFMARAGGSVTIDDKHVSPRKVTAMPIAFDAVADNPMSAVAGKNVGVGCGLWFEHPGLAPGKHRVVIKGYSGNFSTEATYEISVEGPAPPSS